MNSLRHHWSHDFVTSPFLEAKTRRKRGGLLESPWDARRVRRYFRTSSGCDGALSKCAARHLAPRLSQFHEKLESRIALMRQLDALGDPNGSTRTVLDFAAIAIR